jgi:hypothetical protein
MDVLPEDEHPFWKFNVTDHFKKINAIPRFDNVIKAGEGE